MIEILIFLAIGLIVFYFAIRSLLIKSDETRIQDIVNQAFGMSAGKIAEQSQQLLQSEREHIKSDLHNKHQMMQQLVEKLQQELKRSQDEIRELEKDRTKTFSQLRTELNEHRTQTTQLAQTTQELSKLLSNNQQRGEWGERIIEDLLVANGLVEGTHFARQKPLANSSLIPDISLILPNQRVVAVDVKFPYSEIQKMAQAESKSQKLIHQRQFVQDVNKKISEVAKYIDPNSNTLDYAILFVPNEMVFSYINQKMPEVIDQAIGKRVLIVSPFTFLIVARTVMESYRNFMMADKLKSIVVYIDGFVHEWLNFKKQFEKMGRTITTLQSDYDLLTGTRVRKMDKKIEIIETERQGGLLTNRNLKEVEQETQLSDTSSSE